MMKGTYFVQPGNLLVRNDGSIQTEAFVAFGTEIPSWLDLRGLVPLDPSEVEQYEDVDEDEGVRVIKLRPKLWALYINVHAGLYDAAPDPGAGFVGSNWNPGFTKHEADQLCREFANIGLVRGHDNAVRF